jgi:hypothetical protein
MVSRVGAFYSGDLGIYVASPVAVLVDLVDKADLRFHGVVLLMTNFDQNSFVE